MEEKIYGPKGQVLHIIGGKVQSTEEVKADINEKQSQLNDTVRLQLLVARIEKAIGKKIDQRVLLAAVGIIAAKAIRVSPMDKHPIMLHNLQRAAESFLFNTYPLETREKLRKAAEDRVRAQTDALANQMADAVVQNMENSGDAPQEDQSR